jgi:hypothetical protein
MQTFNASGLLSVMRGVALWSTDGEEDETMPDHLRKGECKALKSYLDTFKTIGLSASRVSLEKLVAALEAENCTWGAIKPLAEELKGRLVDETKDKVFFRMTLRESDFFNQPMRGWEASTTRFPNILDDVEEASKCFALSRYAAAVFHSVQIVEAGLIELGIFLKVSDPKSGWTAISKALHAVIQKPHKDRTIFEKRNFPFLEQTSGTVEALKNAWRNKISHSHGKLTLLTTDFSPDVAEEILMATRAFMRRLTEGLPPPRKKKA